MNKRNFILLIKKHYYLLLLLLAICCKKAELPKTFTSYSEAIAEVRGADFSKEEEISISDSEFISSAEYRSDDNQHGYLILNLSGKDYIYDNVPQSIWESFKNSNDKNGFYNDKIKNRYTLTLNGKEDAQCAATTKKGTRCKRAATYGDYCKQHSKIYN